MHQGVRGQLGAEGEPNGGSIPACWTEGTAGQPCRKYRQVSQTINNWIL